MTDTKEYIIVQDKVQLMDLFRHITDSKIIAYDIETSTLNPRTGQIIGFSVSGEIGVGFYFPTLVWNGTELEELYIDGKKCNDLAVKLINMLKGKKLIMHNGSFDIRYTKCYFGIDLREDLYCDTMLLRHTLKEDGPFGLKDIAIELQNELELDVERQANEEQLLMKENIKKNGGSVSKENYEIYKADMDLLGKYAAADTDLTLRVATYYLPVLEEQKLWDFFFTEEVMPLYREVTISMEEGGTLLNIDYIKQVKQDITVELKQLENDIVKELVSYPEVQKWAMDRAYNNYKPNTRGSYIQKLLELTKQTHLPLSDKGKYKVNAKTAYLLTNESVKQFVQTGNESSLDNTLKMNVCLQLMKEDEGSLINISSKQQMADICFNYLELNLYHKHAKVLISLMKTW